MPSHPPFERRPAYLALAMACALPASVMAQTAAPPPQALQTCAEIAQAADRLACYDQLAGRAPDAPLAPVVGEGSTSALVAKGTPPSEPRPDASLLSKFWELEPEDKRGIFNFTGYHANYLLPFHITNRINRSPHSPTQAPVAQPNYRNVEAKFQMSVRTKLVQDVPVIGGDLWAGFTQQAMWQIWNGQDSKPFRNTDYEPELIYVVRTPKALQHLPWGWQWRYGQLALAHQSNGQSDPLSRSWNRVYLGAGFERGNWSLTTRLARRLSEPLSSDNNPDLVSFRGRGEFQLTYASGPATTSLLYRTTLQDGRFGALQLEWSYPYRRSQPNGLRWFVQAFTGYGETLTDYNFRQTSLGVGVSFMQF